LKTKTRLTVFAAAAAIGAVLLAGQTFAINNQDNPRFHEIVSFFSDHSHDHEGGTNGVPQHSGGTDSYGCHNGSVPYHCH